MATTSVPARADADELRERLPGALARHLGPPGEIARLERLTGGATKRTWAVDARVGAVVTPLVLQQHGPRALPAGDPMAGLPRVAGADEARLLVAAGAAGMPVPRVRAVLDEADGLGPGVVTDRVAGETLGRRVVREPALAAARGALPAQCGRALAALHGMDPAAAPFLIVHGAAEQLALYRAVFESFEHPQPVIELGLAWAAARCPRGAAPGPAPAPAVVHGDFRNGNLVVGPDGLRAVLDWEIAHLGDPMEDLGWLCVKTWRFGGALRVGGFGERAVLFEAYERAGGGAVDPARVAFWEAFGCIKWSIMCLMKGHSHLRGAPRSLEQLAIGRRAEEPLHDFLEIIDAT